MQDSLFILLGLGPVIIKQNMLISPEHGIYTAHKVKMPTIVSILIKLSKISTTSMSLKAIYFSVF